MPFPLLAHQAPVLPLKAWRPALFNGTALVIGSVAPDLQNFWSPRGSSVFGHTLSGQLTFCLPLTMAFVLLIGHLRLGAVVCARIGRIVAWIADAAIDVKRRGGILRAVMSALLGSFSHIGFDALTHDIIPRRMEPTVHHFGQVTFSNHAIVQAVASIIGALVTLWLMARISSQLVSQPTARRPGVLLLAVSGVAGALFGLYRAVPAIRHPDWFFEAGRIYVWGYVAFFLVIGAALGIIVAASFLAWCDRAYVTGARAAEQAPPPQ